MLCLSPILVAASAGLLYGQGVGAVTLSRPTLDAFNDHVRKAEARIDAQVHGPKFLWIDSSPDLMNRVRSGETVVQAVIGKGDLQVQDGLIHDWIGAVFVPGVTLAKTMAMVQNYDNQKNVYKPEVMDSKLLSRKGDDFQIYLKLLKHKVITVVLNTWHDAHFDRAGDKRVYSRSYTTKITEAKDSGAGEYPPDTGHGFMWRLNSYWRFEERDGGVYIECEAISLSRDVPAVLRWMISPIVRSLPRESLTNTLVQTRNALR